MNITLNNLNKFINEIIDKTEINDVELYILIENIDDDEFDIEKNLYYYYDLYDKYEYQYKKFNYVELIIEYNVDVDENNVILTYDINELNKLNIGNNIIDVFDDDVIIEINVDDVIEYLKRNDLYE